MCSFQSFLRQSFVIKVQADIFYKFLKEINEQILVLSYELQVNSVLPKIPGQEAYYCCQLYLYYFTVVQGYSERTLNNHTFAYNELSQ